MMKLYLIVCLVMISLALPANVTTLTSFGKGAGGKAYPRPQAVHFCQLLVCDNDHRIMPLSAFIRQQSPLVDDSLSIEQFFTTYVFDYEGWQTLRIFPHQADDGTTSWYAPDDALPQNMSEEHRKYIAEVFPRLISEVEAGNWDTVDAYIERMIQYQCQFGGKPLASQPTFYGLVSIFLAIPLLILFQLLFRK